MDAAPSPDLGSLCRIPSFPFSYPLPMNRGSTLQKRDLKPSEQLSLQHQQRAAAQKSPELSPVRLRGAAARLGWLSHTAGRVIMGDSLVTPLINHAPAWYRPC